MTLTDKLESYFKERPNIWIDGLELARIAGAYAWRSRCSDLRRRGMVIENEQRVGERPDGSRFKRSLYRYTAPKGQMELSL